MARCRHGFERSVIDCPKCGPLPRERQPPTASLPPEGSLRARPGGLAHPGFVDMTGQSLAHAVVLRRGSNDNGNACWLVQLPCEHRQVEQGIKLRAAHKSGAGVRCRTCGENSRNLARHPEGVMRRARPHAKPIAGCR